MSTYTYKQQEGENTVTLEVPWEGDDPLPPTSLMFSHRVEQGTGTIVYTYDMYMIDFPEGVPLDLSMPAGVQP